MTRAARPGWARISWFWGGRNSGLPGPSRRGVGLIPRLPGAPGVVTGYTAGKSFTDQLAATVGMHGAWDRAPDVMASTVPLSSRPDNLPNGGTHDSPTGA